MDKVKDSDYLYLSGRIKVLERHMLSKDKLVRLASMSDGTDAVKLLEENGWNEFNPSDMRSLEKAIDKKRREMQDLLYKYSSDRRLIDVFRLVYDYHNIKVMIKADALDLEADDLYSEAGTVPPLIIRAALSDRMPENLHPIMQNAMKDAAGILKETGDPQLSDMLLDKAMGAHMLAMAEETGMPFLIGYVRLTIDTMNIRILARAVKNGKGLDYMLQALMPGGVAPVGDFREEVMPETFNKLFGESLPRAAEAARRAVFSGETMAKVDMECDNALIQYIEKARRLPFGAELVVSYLLGIEAELISVRIVMSGRASGMSPEQIIERLRKNDV